MNDFIFNALKELYNDHWTEDLLSIEFIHIHRALQKREYMVLELKIQFYNNGADDNEKEANSEIAKLLRVKVSTLNRILYDIKHVFRHGLARRVDNKMHPEIYRAKRKKARMERYGYFRSNIEGSTLGPVREHDGSETSES